MKRRKSIAVILMLAMLVALFAGCGKKTKKENSEPQQEFVYVPKYLDYSFRGDYNSNFIFQGDKLTYLASTYSVIENEEEFDYIVTPELCTLELASMEEQVQNVSIEGKTLDCLAMSPDGTVYGIAGQYAEDDANGHSLVKLGETGEFETVADITYLEDRQDLEWGFYVSKMLAADSAIYLLASETLIVALDYSGQKLFEVKQDGWINALGYGGNNVPMMLYHDSKLKAAELSPDKKGLGQTYTGLNNAEYISPDGANGMFLMNDKGVDRYDMLTGKTENLLAWTDVDIIADSYECLSCRDNGNLLLITRSRSDMGGMQAQLIELVKTPIAEVKETKTLVLGCFGSNDSVARQVVEFNKSQDEYRIKIVDYSNTAEDYEVALMNFNNAITSSDCPDLISLSDLTYSGGWYSFADKGLLVDIDSYLKQDAQINRDRYYPVAFQDYTYHGKTYAMTSSCVLNLYYTSHMAAGEDNQLTLEEALAYMTSSDCKQVMAFATKEEILRMALAASGTRFFDYEQGKVNLDNEDFKNVLRFANYGYSIEELKKYWETYDEQYYAEDEMLAGRLLLCNGYVDGWSGYSMYKMLYGQGVLSGFPTSEDGAIFTGSHGSGVAITSKCKYPDVAWTFLRNLMTVELNEEYYWDQYGFPTEKDAFEEYYRIVSTSDEVMTWGYNDKVFEVSAPTSEEKQEILSLMERAISYEFDQELLKMIMEEAGAYFAGQKSVDEVVSIIQNRVSLYISETY